MTKIGYTTASRTKILEFLKQNSDRTVTVQDINNYLIDNGHEVNLTTIYRYLDKLVKETNVLKYPAENGSQVMYQYVESEHHCEEHLHLQCVKCGVIVHLECDFMEEIASHIKMDHQFTIQCKNSIIYGVCNNCK